MFDLGHAGDDLKMRQIRQAGGCRTTDAAGFGVLTEALCQCPLDRFAVTPLEGLANRTGVVDDQAKQFGMMPAAGPRRCCRPGDGRWGTS